MRSLRGSSKLRHSSRVARQSRGRGGESYGGGSPRSRLHAGTGPVGAVDTGRPTGEESTFRYFARRRPAVSWSISGTYFETCSCELMCPCNFSFDHGATYDYCRVTLVFDIRNGEIDGTDVGGRTLALIADTPKVMT